ncbi:hypothetical protein [Thiolapillus sp.]|uniref:hypothetical protein n=1 Tax=Thiolapillus sp. TaxID=2017437 RepID=UPI003AF6CBC8
MFSLWRKARRENSAASRLLGSTSLRFALHGWQRKKIYDLSGLDNPNIFSAPQQNLWVAEVGLRQMIRSGLSG